MERRSRTPGHFVETLERLTAQLRDEYERDVHGLEQQVRQLKAQLSHAQADGGDAPIEPVSIRSASATQDMMPRNTDASWRQSASTGIESSQSKPGTMGPDLASPLSHFSLATSNRRGRVGFNRRMLGSGEYVEEADPSSSNPALAFLARLVASWWFELFFSILIVLNAVVLGFEAQYFGMQVGNTVGYHQRDAADEWPWAATFFEVFSWIFGIVFTIEVLLRIFGLRYRFVCDFFNWMDLAIVLVWIMGKFGRNLPINTQLIRLTRLGKLVRLMRLVKNIQGLDSLFLVTTSLKGSISVLTWTSVLLFVVLLLNALLLNQILTEFYLTNAAFPESERQEVYRYFGSFTTSLFSMFELTLANWPPISRVLYENVSEWFILFTLIHKVTIGFAVVGVINGVFMQETFKVAQHDDELMVRRVRTAKQLHDEKMRRLVATADKTGEGVLDLEAFRHMFRNPGISAWLASMELIPQDVDQLFKMMDDGDGTLSIEELVKGVAKFKGSARNIDLQTLLYENRRLLRLFEQHVSASPGAPSTPAKGHDARRSFGL